MGLWGQSGRRGKRLPNRLLGHFLDSGYGTAEGVLGAVAVVLVVWLLWPEGQGPQIDQRAVWQKSVEQVERRRARLEVVQTVRKDQNADTLEEVSPADQDDNNDVVESDRGRIATPSEFADRIENVSRSIQPAPQRPSDLNGPVVVLATPPRGADTSDVAALSSEGLETEPLPAVDLSDLDTLVPTSEILTKNVVQAPAETSVETQGETEVEAAEAEPAEIDVAAVDPGPSDQDALTPAPDAAIEPFIIENDPAQPTTDVRERPRDDAPTWLRNAVTTAIDDERPIIAVVIDDLGLNRYNTAALNTLPAPLTLAFLPYAGKIEAQTEAANAAGHELMLHMPMEPFGSDWPGPDALTTRIDQDEFITRLFKNLDRFDGFVGINNHMGSRLTADASRMEVVMRELRKRDVLFLDSKTSPRSIAGDVAEETGVPNTTRDVFLDHVIDLQAIKRQLALTERLASQNGSAVAIGHPHGATIEALTEWLPSLEQRGFKLAPISAVVARRACRNGILIAPQTCGRYLQANSSDGSSVAANDG